jgi:hypothetical protein
MMEKGCAARAKNAGELRKVAVNSGWVHVNQAIKAEDKINRSVLDKLERPPVVLNKR